MKYYIIAGEASGDLHGSNLIKELKAQDPQSEFRCWGGDLMEEQGAQIVKHYKELAFMGFIEVLFNLKTILNNIRFCKEDIVSYQPDVVIFVDYPGFNLRIAEFVKSLGIHTYYYISPQIWAWKENRIEKIKQYIDKMYVILPFEQKFYQNHDYPVEYLGHPLLDVITYKNHSQEEKNLFKRSNNLSNKPIISILPGSRKQEISRMLPIMLSVISDFPDYQFVIAGAPNIEDSFYEKYTRVNINVLSGKTQELYKYSEAGLITSGTATLEAALHGLPEIVCYKANAISYAIARKLIKVKFISLVNLIADKLVVKEMIQGNLDKKNLTEELNNILNDQDYRNKILDNYSLIRKELGNSGASKRIATHMLKSLNTTQ